MTKDNRVYDVYAEKLDTQLILREAQRELREEIYREAIDKMKLKLKNKRSLWDIIFPFRIVIIKKEKV